MAKAAADYKEFGNKFFKEQNFAQAIEMYGEAIRLSPGSAVLYSNRAQACLKVQNYLQALQDAEKALQLKPDEEKHIFRKASALKGLQQFDAALETIQNCTSTARPSQQFFNRELASLHAQLIQL